MFYFKLYMSMLLCFLAVDLLWLGVIARGFYQKQLEFLLRSSPNWPVAILFYMIYITGILVFVVSPRLTGGVLAKGAASWGVFWIGDLRNLRFNQSRDRKWLAVDCFGRRSVLGDDLVFNCRNVRLLCREMVKCVADT